MNPWAEVAGNVLLIEIALIVGFLLIVAIRGIGDF